ncbi:hypothetical protein QUA20_21805 [Microcoleus sp. Pol7_A1]|uniref:hypothetical protein n=1 Tax=Microcoleus sp. Pol7_A1 TaxID=2818893 RepID=UPI002FD4F650
MSKWRSVFGASRLTIDSIESSIAIAAVSVSNLRHPSQKERRPIATAWAIEFLPLKKSSCVTDDRTNTRPNRIS